LDSLTHISSLRQRQREKALFGSKPWAKIIAPGASKLRQVADATHYTGAGTAFVEATAVQEEITAGDLRGRLRYPDQLCRPHWPRSRQCINIPPGPLDGG